MLNYHWCKELILNRILLIATLACCSVILLLFPLHVEYFINIVISVIILLLVAIWYGDYATIGTYALRGGPIYIHTYVI